MKRATKTLLAVATISAAAAVPLALSALGDTTRVSLNDNEAQPNQASLGAAVSADGRYVAFATSAQLTATPVGAGVVQLYVRDRQTNATVLASSSGGGEAANANVDSDAMLRDAQFAISGDGRYVVFASTATNLLVPDGNAAGKDVFRKDLQTSSIIRVNVSAGGGQSAGVGGDPDVSYDGSRVIFSTGTATDLFATDANAALGDIALRDIGASTNTLISQNSAGQQATTTTERASISADGRHVVLQAPNDDTVLIPGDANAGSDVVVRDTVAGTTTRASLAVDGTAPANGGAGFPDISGDGRYVVFEGPATYDPVNATAATNNIYRRDLISNTTLLLSSRNALAQGGDQGGVRPAISADGSRVAFESASTNLIAGDTNADPDVYVRDAGASAAASATSRASTAAGGAEGANASTHAAIAGNGGFVAFTYDDNPGASPMVSGDTNALSDVFVKEFAPSDTTGPAINVASPAPGTKTEAGQATITGTVTPDPSGNIETTVAGVRVTPGAGGAFSHTVALTVGVNAIAVTARDGSGNLATTTVTVERVAAPITTPKPPPVKPTAARITQLKVLATRRTVTARFRLTRSGTVRVELKRLPRLKAVRKPISRALRLGRNTIVMRTPRLNSGRYRLILTVRSPGGITRITRTFAMR
jgi:Tol biopolymer transport system component